MCVCVCVLYTILGWKEKNEQRDPSLSQERAPGLIEFASWQVKKVKNILMSKIILIR